MNATGFFTEAEKFEQERGYQDMLVERYLAKLPMSKLDKAEAKRIIKRRQQQN